MSSVAEPKPKPAQAQAAQARKGGKPFGQAHWESLVLRIRMHERTLRTRRVLRNKESYLWGYTDHVIAILFENANVFGRASLERQGWYSSLIFTAVKARGILVHDVFNAAMDNSQRHVFRAEPVDKGFWLPESTDAEEGHSETRQNLGDPIGIITCNLRRFLLSKITKYGAENSLWRGQKILDFLADLITEMVKSA
ncbi:hypothetical protein B0H11DRAFT_1908332 [Mycena galericulata]|nr:hypothetical protein B0H11DRAFT_1908332 [Mycena galericulata]